nr:MAG TPA: hypothetical protein [Caudoviricetes sp.]
MAKARTPAPGRCRQRISGRFTGVSTMRSRVYTATSF